MIHVKKIYKGRKKIIEGLKTEIFSINCDEIVKEQARYKEEEKNIGNDNGLIDYWRLARLCDLKYRDINDELVRNQFLVQGLKELLEKMRKSRNNLEKNKYLQKFGRHYLKMKTVLWTKKTVKQVNHRFKSDLTHKLNLKDPNKTWL